MLLIKYPTRSRLAKSLDTLKTYIRLANDKERLRVIVSLDEDDVNCVANADKYRAVHANVEVHIGPSEGKVAAINRDMPPASAFDILLLASDDMIPQVQGYDDIIRDSMAQFYPDGDGVLFFNDGFAGSMLNTLVICGSAYYERWGYIYSPAYKSLCCDIEFMQEAQRLGRQTYFDQVIIRHEHPNHGKSATDQLYSRNGTFSDLDNAVLMERTKPQYDISILISAIATRHDMLVTLLEDIEKYKVGKVQVLFDTRLGITLGAKRNALLNRATGKYCAFVDDDDKITPDYFKVIADALASGIDYDCIQLNGRYYENGRHIKPFRNSLQYKEWYEDAERYYRSPNHLNPIKTSICKRIWYSDINGYEDHDFSKRLVASGLAKTEYTHNVVQYLYYKTWPAPAPAAAPSKAKAKWNILNY